jgi:hypothetical protein
MWRRHFSAIVFDVKVEAADETPEQVMYRVFALTPAVSLRSWSQLIYQSGDYRQTVPGVWTGRMDRIRVAQPSYVQQGPDGAYRFTDVDTEVPTAQATAIYAYAPAAGLLLYQDTAEIPFTRIPSYVHGALMKGEHESVDVTVTPRRSGRLLREWLDHFTAIDRVTVTYRHSQSPGNRAIDSVLEAWNAVTATETIAARDKEHLNKAELLNSEHSIGRAFDHLEKAGKNGEARIQGYVDGEKVKLDTRNPVERHMLEVEEAAASMRGILARAALRISGHK